LENKGSKKQLPFVRWSAIWVGFSVGCAAKVRQSGQKKQGAK
jgi:hypothetical protein